MEPAYLAFLKHHVDLVNAAGPLHTSSGGRAGGTWIVESENEEALVHLVKDETFWATGLREPHRILSWNRAQSSPHGSESPLWVDSVERLRFRAKSRNFFDTQANQSILARGSASFNLRRCGATSQRLVHIPA